MASERAKYLVYPLVVAIIIVGVLFVVTSIERREQPETVPSPNGAIETPPIEKTPDMEEKPLGQEGVKPAEAPKTDVLNMKEVVASRTTWNTAFTNWYGRQAPDFTLKGLDGKSYTLKVLQGRDVMVVFWATWCGPCRVEIPHLKELRKEFSSDQLEILAISNEDPGVLKEFVRTQNIPYTVLVGNGMPDPYSRVNSIPCSFFIDPQGNIKLAAVGTMDLQTMKNVLKAQW